MNLSRGELTALLSLKRRTDIVIEPGDKGGAVVVWDRDLYIQEAERQLAENNFYQRVDQRVDQRVNLTTEHQNKVISVVQHAIANGELPATATNLIVDHRRTSKFYLLPKIHKPGNPGRPIVSACNCPTELLATYLDQVTSPLVRSLPSYVKDTNHMLDIAQTFSYPTTSANRFVFTMDIKSLYTVIPNNDGLLALTHFLDKRPVLEPPTYTLVRLAELVLTLNSFSFNGGFYQQTGGVAMGSRLGPNYACLFVGHVEEQIFQQYPGRKPDLYKRYIDDIVGAASCSKSELDDFATFVNNFHPSLQFTWAISDKQLPFLDLFLTPTPQGLATTIHYKETDSHSYLTYTSAHPVQCKDSVPYSQFLRLKRICSDENDYNTKSKEMSSFFLHREYPPAVVERALQRVNSISRETALRPSKDGQSNEQVIPLVLTYNPINRHVKNILSKNFSLLKSDPETKELFDNSRVLGAYRRDTNLRDSLVRSSLQSGANTGDEPHGTFPCHRPRCRTCAHANPASQINTPGGPLTILQRFSCTTSNIVYIITCRACTMSYIGETG
ncbi:uncharacterized protein LOC144640130, partial [Oculina patagonica]